MFDLHSHSNCSDGDEAPETVVDLAYAAGLDLFALTDHDCVGGIEPAISRARELGLPMLTGTETEAEYPATLHILGLGIDIDAPCFRALMERQEQCREERNAKLEARLRGLGMDVTHFLVMSKFCTTRANYAAALVEAGFASSMDDAFKRIVGNDGIAYVKQEHPTPAEVITAINGAGGVAVVAHPMKMRFSYNKKSPAELINELAELGLWGVEAYYYSATEGETRLYSSLARQYGLYVTCGSDFHGARRPEARIGACYRDCPELLRTREALKIRFGV